MRMFIHLAMFSISKIQQKQNDMMKKSVLITIVQSFFRQRIDILQQFHFSFFLTILNRQTIIFPSFISPLFVFLPPLFLPISQITHQIIMLHFILSVLLISHHQLFYKIRCMDLPTFIQNNLALLQRYLFAENKAEFLKSQVTVPQDRKIFDYLLNSISDKERELIGEFRLNESQKAQLYNAKAFRELNRASSEEEKLHTINRVKELSSSMFFDYPKPVQVTENSNVPAEMGQKVGKIPPIQFETEATVRDVVIRALDESVDNFPKLSTYGLKNLPLERLSTLSEHHIQYLFEKKEILRSLDPQTIAQYLSHMITKLSKEKNSTQQEELPSDFFTMLNYEQLLALQKRLPKLFESYEYHLQLFREKYEEKFLKFKEITSLTLDERSQKKNLCNAALNEIKSSKKDFYENLIQKLTEEILLIDEVNVNSDLQLFITYLKNIRSVNYENFDNNFKAAKKDEYGRNKYLNKSFANLTFLQASKVNQSDLINRTVISLFKADNTGTLEQLSKFLSRKFLIKEQAKVKLSLGLQKDLPNIHEIFTTEQLNDIKERKEVTFLPSNKKRFGAKDKVALEIRLKNIKKFTKKIYTIDLEKQLLQNNRNIEEDINLKFLVPQFQEEILTKQVIDPFEELKRVVTFDELENKLGEFIVELEGQGITSRAIIRKGHIFLENKPKISGHELTFYDEQGKLIEELVIWRDSKRIEVKGSYFIPYGPQGNEEIIAVFNNHAQKLLVNINNQNFTFDCDYLYHSQSFIVGNKAKIILHPILKLNNTRANLQRLRNVSITISSVNNQDISSTQVIDNVVFKNNEDYVVEYPIKAYIKSFTILVNGQIELIDKKITKINHVKNVFIDLEENVDNFIDIYLEKNYKGVYTVKIRGKNGESIRNAQISLSYEQFGANYSFSNDLTTDENGELSLGKLLQVTRMTIKVTQNNFVSTRSWKLNNFGENITYGSNLISNQSYKIYLKEGQSFALPLPCELNLQNDVIFQRQRLGLYYNLLSNVVLTKNKLSINALEIGSYNLTLLRLNRSLSIQVIRGKEWIGEKLVNDNNQVYSLTGKKISFMSLGEIRAEVKQDNVEYSIDILSACEKLPADLRVHVFAKNYIDSENPQFLNCESKVIIPRPEFDTLNFRTSSYFNNKKLSDETAYVINRKTQEVTNGNNLEKPHIFLKRVEVRSTQEKDEVLRNEGDYQMQRQMACYGARPQMMKCAMDCREMDGMLFGGAAQRRYAHSSVVSLNRTLNSHNNFLYKVGHLNSNLRQITSIQVPKGYNQLVVYVFAEGYAIKREYALPESKIEKLRLTHLAIRDADKKSGWTMSREIYQVHRGEEREISRSSTWTTVGLSNVVEYAKIQGITLPEWLTSWQNYSQQKKLEVYDKQICHELNFYIYRNDRVFFNEVVKPFIKNKLRKTIVDHYLLDDQAELVKYGRAHVLNNLNSFEKAILVQKLKAYGRDRQADNLASSLELPLKVIKKSNEQFKKFFETVLNAKKEAPVVDGFQNASRFGGGGGGIQEFEDASCPPPPGAVFCYAQPEMMMMRAEQCCQQMDYLCDMGDMKMVDEAKQRYKPGFKETEKTKQYTETTYSGINNPSISSGLIPLTSFWAELARHFSEGKTNQEFLSDKFSDFSQKIQFVLACAIFSSEAQADYELTNHQNGYKITAKNPFLIFVREVKSLAFQQSKNIVLNQRFFDPKNRYSYDEEGNQVEKEVETFLIQKPYAVQTLITNISGSNLELQLLMDIPEGSIPLLSHEQTQIINVSLPAYNTKSFERTFYFPEQGKYAFYPANASKGRAIISKSSEIDFLTVATKESTNTLETLDNILRSGSDEDIFNFIKTKNIFDYNVFNFDLILWKLKDRDFFNKIIAILKERQYYHSIVWSFAVYHNDFELVKEFFENSDSQPDQSLTTLPIFEYYPYYSRRAHKFADQNKSTIRVKEFRQNYAKFLFSGIFTNRITEPYFVLTHIYYLILQDRIIEARNLYRTVSKEAREQFKIQYDYIDCFLDMYGGAETDYAIARKISEEYMDYPVQAWRKLFIDVYETLHKSSQDESESSTKEEEVAFTTTVVNSGTEVKITRPAQVKVIANLYEIDIELYFSEFPFEEITRFSAIKPTRTKVYEGAEFKVEKLDRKCCEGLKNVFVQIYEQKLNTALNKVSSFFWTNPEVKVKINEKQGTLKVFHNGKKCPTSYVKVYSKGAKGIKFSRDGYTDVASIFRYALDVKDIEEFAILVLTDHGGSIHRVKPPSIY